MLSQNEARGASKTPAITPETFRLPRPGDRDPYFGLNRAAYYKLESAGALRFIRLCQRGCKRGITLIPYDQVHKLVREAGDMK